MLTASSLEKQTRPKEHGAADGKNDFPPTSARSLASETEQKIEGLCQEEMASEHDNFAKTINNSRTQIASVRQTLPKDIPNNANGIKAGLKTILMEHADSIGTAATEVEKRAKDLRQFKVLNELKFEPEYNASFVDLIGTAILIAAIESAANAYFFGQASEAGIVGGFFTAGMVSLINVGLGFTTGLCFRQLNHIKKWRMLFALPALFVLICFAVVFNLIVGHYREALIKNPDAIIIEIIPEAMSNLLGVRSFDSMILILLGLFIFAISAYKGYKVWDTYPGYMSKHKAVRDAEENLREQRDRANEDVDRKLKQQIDQFNSIGPSLSSKRATLDAVSSKIDSTQSALTTTLDQIEQAANAVIQIYRTANQQVRNPKIAPPTYFQSQFKLIRIPDPSELKQTRDELTLAYQEIAGAEASFHKAQADLGAERIAIMGNLQDEIAKAETNARNQVKADRAEEDIAREKLAVSV